MSRERIVFFDVETGGLEAARHPIIQFAAVAVDADFHELETVERKLMFREEDCDPSALAANHYDPAVWRDKAIPQTRGVELFGDFCRRHATMSKVSKAGKPYSVARLAAHNAPFDAGFAIEWFKVSGTFLPAACYEALDTLGLARWVSLASRTQPKDHKLGSLCEWLGIPLDGAHDALTDVRATVEVTRKLFAILGMSIEGSGKI